MNSSKIIRGLLLLVFALLGSAPSFAQDSTKLSVDHTQITGWNFSVSNGNPSKFDIKHIGLKILTPGIAFLASGTSGGASDWVATSPVGTDTTQVSYDYVSTTIKTGQTLSAFSFSLDVPYQLYDKPVVIQWKTSWINDLTTGTWTVTPTLYQSYTALDQVSLTAAILPNGDPGFTFDVKSLNSPSYAIKALSIQLLDPSRGQFRPLDAHAPSGWTLDSVLSYTAYFHTDGQGISSGHDLNGFMLGLRSDQQPKIFSFVWRAYNTQVLADSGAFIDRDTISSTSLTPGIGSVANNADSVHVSNTTKACTFNTLLSNYHISNSRPPSPIGGLILNIATSGVTFNSATAPNADWGKSISADKKSVTFVASDPSLAFGGGTTSSFGTFVDNPSGNNFTINWLALGAALDTIDQGSYTDSCVTVVPKPDVATLTPMGSCDYKLTIKNTHVPNSSLHSVGLQIAAADGKFATGTGIATQGKWAVSQAGAPQSLLFYDTSKGNVSELGLGQSVDIMFSIVPKTPGANVPIRCLTFDLANGTTPVGIDTVNATCTIAPKCDSVRGTYSDCTGMLTVQNNRGTGKAVTKILVTPLGGRTVLSASANVGWTHDIAPDNSTAAFTSSTGISDGTQQTNFVVNFHSSVSGKFGVQIATTDVDNNVCTKIDSLSCTASGVAPSVAAQMLAMSVSPNPFSGRTDVTFTLADRDHTSIVLLDVLGRVQQTVQDGALDMGTHSIMVDGSSIRPGTYYLRLETSSGRVTKKLVVNK